jgi:hypothetical protein
MGKGDGAQGGDSKDNTTAEYKYKTTTSPATRKDSPPPNMDILLEEGVDAIAIVTIPSPRKDVTPPASPRQAAPQQQQPIPTVEPISPAEPAVPLEFVGNNVPQAQPAAALRCVGNNAPEAQPAAPLAKIHPRSFAELNTSFMADIFLPRETTSRCPCNACNSVCNVHLEQQPSHYFHLEVGFRGDLILGTRRVAGLPFTADPGLRMGDTQIVGVSCSQATANGMRQFSYSACGGLKAAAFAEDELFETHSAILEIIHQSACDCLQRRKATSADVF